MMIKEKKSDNKPKTMVMVSSAPISSRTLLLFDLVIPGGIAIFRRKKKGLGGLTEAILTDQL